MQLARFKTKALWDPQLSGSICRMLVSCIFDILFEPYEVTFTVADQISSAHAIETSTELVELSANQISDCYKPFFLDDTFGYTIENGLESNQTYGQPLKW